MNEVFLPNGKKLIEEVKFNYCDTDILTAYSTPNGVIVRNNKGGVKMMTFKEFINYAHGVKINKKQVGD